MTARRVDNSVVPSAEADFRRDITRVLNNYGGRIVGFHIMLLVDSEDDAGTSDVVLYREWPSRLHLIGHLEVAKQRLVCETPKEESQAGA